MQRHSADSGNVALEEKVPAAAMQNLTSAIRPNSLNASPIREEPKAQGFEVLCDTQELLLEIMGLLPLGDIKSLRFAGKRYIADCGLEAIGSRVGTMYLERSALSCDRSAHILAEPVVARQISHLVCITSPSRLSYSRFCNEFMVSQDSFLFDTQGMSADKIDDLDTRMEKLAVEVFPSYTDWCDRLEAEVQKGMVKQALASAIEGLPLLSRITIAPIPQSCTISKRERPKALNAQAEWEQFHHEELSNVGRMIQEQKLTLETTREVMLRAARYSSHLCSGCKPEAIIDLMEALLSLEDGTKNHLKLVFREKHADMLNEMWDAWF